MNEKENQSKKHPAKTQSIFTTEEKAQFEVFANGSIPKERLEEMIRYDLEAVASLVHTIRHDKEIYRALCDVYYKRYVNLHPKAEEDVDKS